MDKRARILAVLVSALAGGALALVGAPPPMPSVDEPSEAHRQAPPAALHREMVAAEPDVDPALIAAAPGVEMAGRNPASQAPIEREIRLCWSPTARRLVGTTLRGNLERRGAKLRVLTESDRGARSRLVRGDDDLGLVAGAPNSEEIGHRLASRVLGYHVLVAIVHHDQPLHGLPRQQLRDALIGVSTAWAHLGGSGGLITVVAVEEDPFTDQASSLVLLGDRLARGTKRLIDDEAVCALVAQTPDALGLCSLAAAQRRGDIRILKVDTIAPSASAYAAGRYPFASPVRLLSRDQNLLTLFDPGNLSDVLSPPP